METENENNAENHSIYKFSWVAYIRPIVTVLIVLLIGIGLSQSKTSVLSTIGNIVLILGLINFICNILYIKTFYMWIDDKGVWVFRGIFPWTKGRFGTMWRDISDAVYFTGLVSWSTKSYRIRVGHRFTKTSELFIPHLKYGNLAATKINEIITDKFSNKA
ncbi:TPA: hypothetical protein VEO38_000546 [Providencia alcalifaciens]|nr:hypothetical protein [Providencia alcalifaciens]